MDFARLNTARGRLFQTVNACVRDGAFLIIERSALNELLADPLAADHLLRLEAGVAGLPAPQIEAVAGELDAADAALRAVLRGANSRSERRDAMDRLDAACDALIRLLDDAADAG